MPVISAKKVIKEGYKSYIDKEPFHLFVSDQFPSNQSMLLKSDTSRTVFDFYDDLEAQTRRASTSIGEDLSTHIELNQDGKPEQLSVIFSLPGQPSQMLRDLNLDGVWDIKYMLETNEQFILLNAQWVRVDKIEGRWPNIKAQSAQSSFTFDMKKGQWILEGQ
jgi:hypothetical protein